MGQQGLEAEGPGALSPVVQLVHPSTLFIDNIMIMECRGLAPAGFWQAGVERSAPKAFEGAVEPCLDLLQFVGVNVVCPRQHHFSAEQTTKAKLLWSGHITSCKGFCRQKCGCPEGTERCQSMSLVSFMINVAEAIA